MQKKSRGILLFTKNYKENDLYVKIFCESNEIISGIVYGGLSKKKRNIYQIGSFININIIMKFNRPPSISGELSYPYMSLIMNDKYKLYCLLSTVSIINLSIIEGQKINNLFTLLETFIINMLEKKKWINSYFLFLFNLLKIIGYEIDYNKNQTYKFFNLDTLEFTNNPSKSSILFPHNLLDLNSKSLYNINSIINIFKIFELVITRHHLSNLNLQLPNQFHLFKKLIIDYLKNK